MNVPRITCDALLSWLWGFDINQKDRLERILAPQRKGHPPCGSMSLRFLAGTIKDDMRVTFVDSAGTIGTVTEEFDINYDGRWENKIEDCVAAVQDDIRDAADREPPPEAVLNELPVRLFTEAPVKSVQTIPVKSVQTIDDNDRS